MYKKSGIYAIQNLVTQKLYIGSSVNLSRRQAQHFYQLRNNNHGSTKLQNSVNKHGITNFRFIVLFYCNKNDLLFYEQRTIDILNTYINGYNAKALAASNLGLKRTEEAKAKMRLAKLGKQRGPHSEETKLKISLAQKGKVVKPCSEETKKKISAANKGKKVSLEQRLLLSKINKGKQHKLGWVTPQEVKDKISISEKLTKSKNKEEK